MSTTIRTYSELVQLSTFEQRFKYLALRGIVGDATFGYDRYVNQQFYRSREWRQMRHQIIARDLGCDLGIEGYEIHDVIYIHHVNPMNVENIARGDSSILDPEFLISTTHRTHNAIHYGDERLLAKPLVDRRPGDTKLW
jgi:hypothetical protein